MRRKNRRQQNDLTDDSHRKARNNSDGHVVDDDVLSVTEYDGPVVKAVASLLGHIMDHAVVAFIAQIVATYVDDGEALSEADAIDLLETANCTQLSSTITTSAPSSPSDISGIGLDGLDMEEIHEVAQTLSLLTNTSTDDTGDEDDADGARVVDDDGCCELCDREIRRTFHHLVPKETHNRYLKRSRLPANLEAYVTPDGNRAECTRSWLGGHGIMICGACHGSIHRAETNKTLAEEYNTLERILSHPKIRAFAEYNAHQRVGAHKRAFASIRAASM